MLLTTFIKYEDDLDSLVTKINQASWDDANDMTKFDVASLLTYLKNENALFVACYEKTQREERLLGIASARVLIKPYENERWLYVDEVDVCVDQRRKGAGKAMMRKLLEYARDAGCNELWLGTEPDNCAANALYGSLSPDEVEQFVGYTYKIESR